MILSNNLKIKIYIFTAYLIIVTVFNELLFLFLLLLLLLFLYILLNILLITFNTKPNYLDERSVTKNTHSWFKNL